MTAGVVTVVYLVIWSLSPSIITLVSVLGLLVTLLDYLVPLITDKLLPRSGWTQSKERKLESAAMMMININLFFYNCCSSYHQAKIR